MSRSSSDGYLTDRQLSPEHMDDPRATAHDLDQALRFIRIVNRRLGGTAAAMSHFRRWAGEWNAAKTIRILDVGTGSADIPLAIAKWAAANGLQVQITAVDLHPITLELARQHIGSREDIKLVLADATKLMEVYKPGCFDYAHAGMFLHHLDDVQVLTVLTIMDRLALRGMIWNDLLRGWFGRVGVRLATLHTPALVRHDALVSVEAGFAKGESLELARRAGWRRPRFRRHMLHRFTVVSDKPEGS